jgi:protein-tyrosine-phosphatase
MMRFSESEESRIIKSTIEKELERYGLKVVRADETHTPEADLWHRIKQAMDACDSGIALFDQLNDVSFNHNVSLEVGYMLAKDIEPLILKEVRSKGLFSDIAGRLYRPYHGCLYSSIFQRIFHLGVERNKTKIEASLRDSLRKWLIDNQVAKGKHEKMIAFVSLGGTCRCAMAKVIVERALRARDPHRLKFESIALDLVDPQPASDGAKNAIKQRYDDEDLLANHRSRSICEGIMEDADLVLPMDEDLVKRISATFGDRYVHKTYLFAEFFTGARQDILDPWRAEGYADTSDELRQRYKECLENLEKTMLPNIPTLFRKLRQNI